MKYKDDLNNLPKKILRWCTTSWSLTFNNNWFLSCGGSCTSKLVGVSTVQSGLVPQSCSWGFRAWSSSSSSRGRGPSFGNVSLTLCRGDWDFGRCTWPGWSEVGLLENNRAIHRVWSVGSQNFGWCSGCLQLLIRKALWKFGD